MWTKSMRLWTKGDSTVPWSMVDQASYPIGGCNLGRPFDFQRPRANGDGEQRWLLAVQLGMRRRSRWRITGMALRCAEAHREELGRERGR
jgi:hypothetical protein